MPRPLLTLACPLRSLTFQRRLQPTGNGTVLDTALGAAPELPLHNESEWRALFASAKLAARRLERRASHLRFRVDGEDAAAAEIAAVATRLGLPVADPIRRGMAFERLLDACSG